MYTLEHVWPGWQIEEQISTGAYGDVYKIKKESYGQVRYAALKVIRIPSDLSEINELLDCGMDEASIAAYYDKQIEQMCSEIAHIAHAKSDSYVVPIEDWEVIREKNGISRTIYIRTEWMENLSAYFRKNPPRPREVAKLGKDICSALEYCHREQMIHCDINPSNLFVTQDGVYKLGGFGMKKEPGKGNFSPQKGPGSYMAPEVFHGKSCDQRADIYSLGMVLYSYLNYGRMPFLPPYPNPISPSDKDNAVYQRMKGQYEVPLPQNCDQKLGEIVQKACSYHPENRYASAAQMKADLERWMAGRKQSYTTPSPVYEEPMDKTEENTIKTTAAEEKKNNSEKQNSYRKIVIPFVIVMGIFLALAIYNRQNPSNYLVHEKWDSTYVFGSSYDKEEVKEINFYDSLKDVPEDSWDASAAPGYGTVKAWLDDGVLSIAADGDIVLNNWSGFFAGYFAGYCNVEKINFNDCVKLEESSNMSHMFQDCKSLTSIDLSGFDTANVESMEDMFYGCESLTSIDVSNFDTSKVYSMRDMFSGCESLTSIDVSNFDTSQVTDMSGMFSGCESLTSIDVSNFNTSQVTDMSYMFGGWSEGCGSLTSIDVSNFDTSQVTDMSSMFSGCGLLTSIDVSNFDTSQVTDMSSMFSGCGSLTSIDVSSFNTSQVNNMDYMFSDCKSLTSVDVSSFDRSNAVDLAGMFSGCSSLTTEAKKLIESKLRRSFLY